MDSLIIRGGHQLSGVVRVSSAKNACLPILAATLLTKNKVVFDNLAHLTDIKFFIKILESLGSHCALDSEVSSVETKKITNFIADYELVRKMRASVLVLGPLLARAGRAEVSLPGGCAIGTRPVDLHLFGLRQLGAKIDIENGYIKAKTKGLRGARILLPFPSVGATENIMMAACLAKGESIIDNAAREPEIEDLGNFLNSLGFNVEGHGSSTIKIIGKSFNEVKSDQVIKYSIIGDRIEASTFIIAALMLESELEVQGIDYKHIESVVHVLEKMGANFIIKDQSIKVLESKELKGTDVETAPYPGFPTDVQAQLMALMGTVKGDSILTENIFENRFMHVPELARMGYKIKIEGKSAFIKGDCKPTSAPVMCTDLRASAALILAALKAKDESYISRIYHLDRGYDKLSEKLTSLGADVERKKL